MLTILIKLQYVYCLHGKKVFIVSKQKNRQKIQTIPIYNIQSKKNKVK